jgi:transcriptional regulator GlxA family with amidase domain
MRRRAPSDTTPSAREPRRVVFLATPCWAGVDLIGALDLLTVTNTVLGTAGRGPGYALEVVAAGSGPVTTWPGLQLVAERPYTSARGAIDTLIVGAFDDPDVARRDPRLIAWVRRTARRTRRVAALCSGVFLLAEAGLLDGRRHHALDILWGARPTLSASDPRSRADLRPRSRRLHVGGEHGEHRPRAGPGRGRLWPAGGAIGSPPHGPLPQAPVGTGSDECAPFNRSRGARRPARAPVLDRRPHRGRLGRCGAGPPCCHEPAQLLPRLLPRARRQPARFVERARVEAARQLLEDTQAGVDAIAARCGFGSAETMRAAFQRVLRVSPHAYRARVASGNGRHVSPGSSLNGAPSRTT